MKWYVWKMIDNEVWYFIDYAHSWTSVRESRTEYTDFDTASRTAFLLDAYVARVQ